MHLPYLATGLAVSFFYGDALGLRFPVKDVREFHRDLEKRDSIGKREAAAELEEVFYEREKRIVCLEDDVLLSFQAYEDDAIQFCSNYLGIQDTTSTTTNVGKTTVTVIGTTVATINGGTTTVPQSTITVTNTQEIVDRRAMLLKRQDPGVTPPAAIFSSCSETPQNSSLISMVSSGCSCLFITPGVDVSTTSIVSTRTITGRDYREATVAATVTSGVTTVTTTSTPTSFGYGGTGSASISYSGNLTNSQGTGYGSTGYSGSGRPTGITDTRSGGLGPRTTTYPGTAVSSGSSIIIPPSNTTITSPTGTGFPPLQGCPFNNGSRYVTLCQTFEIQCYINYDGPIQQGLIEPDLYQCIEGCAIANVGFSQLRCYAVSYIPSAVGPNCFFKTRTVSEQPIANGLAVSALLIGNGTCSNSTSSTSRTLSSFTSASSGFPVSSNSSMYNGASGSPTFNVTSRGGSTGPTGSFYSNMSPSMTPSASMNISSISFGFPTAPNITIPTPTNSRDATFTSGNSSGCSACKSYTTSIVYSTSVIYSTFLPIF
ncbi:MAG: hypothetical protein Q9217_002530 [Psora testacea]